MRNVAHPEHLYIQVSDEDDDTLSFAFNDCVTLDDGIDPNAFDAATLARCETMLANVFMRIYNLRTCGERIKPLEETKRKEKK